MLRPPGLIQTHKGWRPMFGLKEATKAQRERDRQIDELRRVLSRRDD